MLSQETPDVTTCLLLCAKKKACYTVLYDGHQCTGCNDFYDAADGDVILQSIKYYQRTSVCGDGWRLWNGPCYMLGILGTFQEGQVDCTEKDGHALTLETESENEHIQQILNTWDTQDTVVFFVGIADDCNGDGVWRQTVTGEVMPFLDFQQYETDFTMEMHSMLDHTESRTNMVDCCVVMHRLLNFKWQTYPCDLHGRTICEKQPN